MTVRALTATLLILFAMLIQAPAGAMTLKDAKNAGLVGERPDGLVGVVSANDDAAALASRINAARLAKYGDIARRTGTSPQAVQIIAGQELTAKAPTGSYVMDTSGTWHRK